MRLHRNLVLAVLALFLTQRVAAFAEHLHHHEEETESSVPTLCHTCHDGCPSDESHHHHDPDSNEHSDGLCPKCVQLLVQLTPAARPVEVPEPIPHAKQAVPAAAPGRVHASLHCCRAPPRLPSI